MKSFRALQLLQSWKEKENSGTYLDFLIQRAQGGVGSLPFSFRKLSQEGAIGKFRGSVEMEGRELFGFDELTPHTRSSHFHVGCRKKKIGKAVPQNIPPSSRGGSASSLRGPA
jgi:hypothetical protein